MFQWIQWIVDKIEKFASIVQKKKLKLEKGK